jgi:hypothetical protein
MPWFSVRRTKVLRVEVSTSLEVEADTEAEAIAQAVEQDGDCNWLEEERETLVTHASAAKIEDAP